MSDIFATNVDPLHLTLKYVAACRTISLLHKNRCEIGGTDETNAQVCAIKSCQNFCNEHTRSYPLDPKLLFGVYQTILLLLESRSKMGQTGAISPHFDFFTATRPIHPIG